MIIVNILWVNIFLIKQLRIKIFFDTPLKNTENFIYIMENDNNGHVNANSKGHHQSNISKNRLKDEENLKWNRQVNAVKYTLGFCFNHFTTWIFFAHPDLFQPFFYVTMSTIMINRLLNYKRFFFCDSVSFSLFYLQDTKQMSMKSMKNKEIVILFPTSSDTKFP